ncbi:MAG: response regulator transcription factor [Thiohalocapsa sp.]|jgi:DNA-binding NarL/FixJ family response regulator|uniref:response regulator transcription factor n=1 Tax=Thiohalocapsa sp. TaxID=2497641 RepID=UPI0025F8E32D|nr:response regulator transcription factor [Thiohalocapsa sp.]MCG6942714.1 response regulator transcription factor [Thiohalocapsa sp.]
MSNRPSRLLVVDDHPVARAGLRSVINAEPDLAICGEVESIRDALKVVRTEMPDLVLVDISLEEGGGMDLIRRLKVHNSALKTLVFSVRDETLFAERAINAGARGYLCKHEGTEQLLDAIRQVLAGRIYLSEKVVERIIDGFGRKKPDSVSSIAFLSDRELEVFDLIGQGLSTSKVAERLHLSVKTVETHRDKIKRKLGLASGGELVRQAVIWHAEQA